jgi:hypothetical protein
MEHRRPVDNPVPAAFTVSGRLKPPRYTNAHGMRYYTVRRTTPAQEDPMPYLTGETVRRVLKDLYGYEVSGSHADSIARGAGATLAMAEHLGALNLADIEPPFSYPVLIAEAQRLMKKKP